MPKKTINREFKKALEKIRKRTSELSTFTPGQFAHHNHFQVKTFLVETARLVDEIDLHFKPTPRKVSDDSGKNKDS